jgi:Ser/Thr protein kinase RdoA (MazF antagonist)
VSDKRRNPIQDLNESELLEFLQGRTLVSKTLFSSGKCNSNYKLILDDGSTAVARISASGSSVRERRVMDLAREWVKVPDTYYQSDALSVVECLKGQILAEVPEHSRLAAKAIAQLSRCAFGEAGLITESGSIEAFDFGGVRGFIEHSLEKPKVIELLGQERKRALLMMLSKKSQMLAEIDAETCLVHGDFNPTNILIHDGQLSGVIDWEYALSGTPFMDIGNLLRNTPDCFHAEIERGLSEGGMALPKDWKERAELVDLTSQLEFLTSSLSQEFKQTCLQRIERCIDKYR